MGKNKKKKGKKSLYSKLFEKKKTKEVTYKHNKKMALAALEDARIARSKAAPATQIEMNGKTCQRKVCRYVCIPKKKGPRKYMTSKKERSAKAKVATERKVKAKAKAQEKFRALKAAQKKAAALKKKKEKSAKAKAAKARQQELSKKENVAKAKRSELKAKAEREAKRAKELKKKEKAAKVVAHRRKMAFLARTALSCLSLAFVDFSFALSSAAFFLEAFSFLAALAAFSALAARIFAALALASLTLFLPSRSACLDFSSAATLAFSSDLFAFATFSFLDNSCWRAFAALAFADFSFFFLSAAAFFWAAFSALSFS